MAATTINPIRMDNGDNDLPVAAVFLEALNAMVHRNASVDQNSENQSCQREQDRTEVRVEIFLVSIASVSE